MSSKIKHHAQKHRLFYGICAVLLVFIVIACTANYRSVIAARKSFYTSTLERQSLSELQLYHEGGTMLVRQYFDGVIGAMSNLATNPGITGQVTGKPSTAVSNILEQQRTITGQFDSLTVLSAKGSVVGFSSNKGSFAPGADASQSVGFTSAKTASGTLLLDVHPSPLKRNILSVVTPIKDAHGVFQGAAIGALTLSNVAEHIKLSSNYNSDLSALLTDGTGNVLVWQNKPIADILNLKDKEPGLAALLHQGTLPPTQEYNFQQQNSLAQGSVVGFGTAGKLHLVSFYNRAGYDRRLKDAVQNINATFASFLVRTAVLLAMAMTIIGVLIRTHDKRTA